MKIVLVVPTIREDCIVRFLTEWDGKHGCDQILVIQDGGGEKISFPVFRTPTYHYDWKDIDQLPDRMNKIFSRKDSAIKSFGFLKALEHGADMVVVLDDDCYPTNDTVNLAQEHINAMTHPKWISSIPDLTPRGMPYQSRGILNTSVNMGLWENVPDLDAPHALMLWKEGNYYHPPTGNRIVPCNQYIPFCGMNFAFWRCAAPAIYFPLMGMNSPYARFDDIWAGIVMKKILDASGHSVSYGEPIINHSKASNVFANLRKEAPGIEMNEEIWRIIDAAPLQWGQSVMHNTKLMGEYLSKNCCQKEYVIQYGKCLLIWASLMEQIGICS